ncbi:hypothetical protein V5O48_001955 [Marasmius crinis-equi]|uniref:GATA-type domain-containing protein n=1 Tax=Marasmius crinis-equi TaxID=585013 RepID=A0ABR3FXG9_9AGAR
MRVNHNHPSAGPGLLRLPTPPPGAATTTAAVIDPALEGASGSPGSRSVELEGVPPKLRRSPAPPLVTERRPKENGYSPPQDSPQLSSNSADRSTIHPSKMPNSASSKRSTSPATSDDGPRRPGSRGGDPRAHDGPHHESGYYSIHHGHPPYHPAHAPLPPMSHQGHYYSHPPPPPPPPHGYYYPPPPPGSMMAYPGHPHQLPPPHSYSPSHQLPHLQSPNSPHPHTLPPPHSHGPMSPQQREPYSPGNYSPSAQGGGYPPPPQNGSAGNVYPSGGGSPTSGEIVYTEDAATKLSDRVRRRCYNCGTVDTSTWRRSNLNPGKVLCNKCGLFERTHSRPRPEQFPHKRGPLSGSTLQRGGSPNGNAYPQPSPLLPSHGQPHLPYPLQTNLPHHLQSSSHPSPLPSSAHSPIHHSPHLAHPPTHNHTHNHNLPPPGSLSSPTTTSSPHSPNPPPHHLPSFASASGSGHHVRGPALPPISTATRPMYEESSRLPQIHSWHVNGPGDSAGGGGGAREYVISEPQPLPIPPPHAHSTNGRVEDGVKGSGGKRKRGEVVERDELDEEDVDELQDDRGGKRQRYAGMNGRPPLHDDDEEELDEEEEERAAAAAVLHGEASDEDEK